MSASGPPTARRTQISLPRWHGFSRGQSFDEQPMADVDSEAIDFRAASESFSGFRKLTERDLDVLGLCTIHRGRRVPSVGGLLLFGRERLVHFPDAWIQAGRFAGTDKSEIVDQADLKMPLPTAIPEAVAFIERHMAAGVPDRFGTPAATLDVAARCRPGSPRQRRCPCGLLAARGSTASVRIRRPARSGKPRIAPVRAYPRRPAARGVQTSKPGHRPRVSRTSPRRTVGQWRAANAGGVPGCRTPRSGLGRDRQPAAGNDATIFQAAGSGGGLKEGNAETASVGKRARTQSTEQAIFDVLESADGLGTSDIAKAIGLSSRATRTRLIGLVDRGLVVEIGRGPHDPKRKYHKAWL